jgi:hypothetical protein
MPLPVIQNGVPLVMSNGSSTVSRTFANTVPCPAKRGGLELVTTDAQLSGVPFTAVPGSINTKRTAGGVPFVLLGDVVTCTDGYFATVPPANCASSGLNVT